MILGGSSVSDDPGPMVSLGAVLVPGASGPAVARALRATAGVSRSYPREA